MKTYHNRTNIDWVFADYHTAFAYQLKPKSTQEEWLRQSGHVLTYRQLDSLTFQIIALWFASFY